MLPMVEYSCPVQLFRTAVLCHVIIMSVTSSDTSSQERVDKTTRKSEEKGGRKTENGDFFCAMGVHVRDGMADLYRPF